MYPVTYYGGKTKLSNGKSAVKICDNATINIHIMASNILGNSRTFKADADVYQSNGSLNAEWKTLKQGSPIKAYGPKHYINNEAYYRVGKNAYVKANTFK